MKRISSNIGYTMLSIAALTAAIAVAQTGQQTDTQQQGDPSPSDPQRAEPPAQGNQPTNDQQPQPEQQQQGQDDKPAAPVVGSTTLGVTMIQHDALALGWSAKKDLLGSDVKNEKGDRIGRVQDLIVSPDGTVSAAILGVGGFVGMGKHDVAIPTNQFKYEGGKFTLPGATADTLKALPEFEYAKKAHPAS